MNEMQIKNKFSLSKLRLNLNRKLLVEVIQWLFFLLFLYSSGDKVFNFEKFKLELSKSPIISELSIYVAYGLPVVETIIGVLVVLPRMSLIGLYASFFLMSLFTAYIFFIMNYSENIPCSCNGILKNASWGQHLIFNIVFVFIAGMGIYLTSKIEKNGTFERP